jgi:hypothetical protein
MEGRSKTIRMDSRTKNILDEWLKYGTVFLVCRLYSYYFSPGKSGEKFFDNDSMVLVILILIGYTIYHLFVHPYISSKLHHPVLKNFETDMLLFGTVMVSSHIMEEWMDDGDYFNREWLKTAGTILFAFAAFDIVIYPFIPQEKLNPEIKPLVNDWMKYGIFLIIFRLLQGKTITNTKWILSVLFVLVGFTGYHLITKRLINTDRLHLPHPNMHSLTHQHQLRCGQKK